MWLAFQGSFSLRSSKSLLNTSLKKRSSSSCLSAYLPLIPTAQEKTAAQPSALPDHAVCCCGPEGLTQHTTMTHNMHPHIAHCQVYVAHAHTRHTITEQRRACSESHDLRSTNIFRNIKLTAQANAYINSYHTAYRTTLGGQITTDKRRTGAELVQGLTPPPPNMLPASISLFEGNPLFLTGPRPRLK